MRDERRTHDDPAFRIKVYPARKFVEVVLIGYWADDVALRFERELRRCLSALPAGGCRIGDQVTLIDSSNFPVQSQATLVHLARIAMDDGMEARRIAVLLSSTLMGMQARRVAPSYRVFTSREDALQWLFEDVRAQPA